MGEPLRWLVVLEEEDGWDADGGSTDDCKVSAWHIGAAKGGAVDDGDRCAQGIAFGLEKWLRSLAF